MSLAEADRLARLGSPVLYSRTLQPLFNTEVSLAVRSSYASHRLYLIAPHSSSASAPVVTNLNAVVLFGFKLTGELTSLLDSLIAAGLTPLAHWTSAHQRVELAYTAENQNKCKDCSMPCRSIRDQRSADQHRSAQWR